MNSWHERDEPQVNLAGTVAKTLTTDTIHAELSLNNRNCPA